MSKELKPVVYYLLRRGWYGQAIQACEAAMSKKGKEPVTLYWHAFSLGMSGNTTEAIREFESFQARKDLHFAMNVALLFFHRRAAQVDKEAVNTLKSELPISEDVTKEAGLILAARLHVLTGNYTEARRLAKKIAGGSSSSGIQISTTSSVFEVEAFLVEQWSLVEEIASTWENSSDQRRTLSTIDSTFRSNNRLPELQDPDSLMLWSKVKYLLGGPDGEVLNILNQTISMHPTFYFSLADKALLLASVNDWDQALDSAQRVMDADADNLDGLQIIAMHAFTQESQPHDAIQKLEDLDRAIKSREPSSVPLALDTAAIFSKVCSRQPRALQICTRLLERAVKNAFGGEEEAEVRCQLAHLYIMQGSSFYDRAMKELREATKRDPQNVHVLLALILGQIVEGQYEDAESQIELLGLMHNNLDDLGFDLVYLQAMIARGHTKGAATAPTDAPGGTASAIANAKQQHLMLLEKCKDMFFSQSGYSSSELIAASGGAMTTVMDPNVIAALLIARNLQLGLTTRRRYLDAFTNIHIIDPEFSMLLALDFFSHIEYAGTTSMIPTTSALLNANGEANGPSVGSSSSGKYGTIAGAEAEGTSSTVNSGGSEDSELSLPMKSGVALLSRIISNCPGMILAYLELSRAYFSIGQFDEASRVLQQALALQPQSSALLLAMAQVECGRLTKASVADRFLEQALSTDFSIRQVPKFRLIKAIIRAQQGKFSESLKEIEAILAAMPELGFAPLTVPTGPGNAAAPAPSNQNNAAATTASTIVSSYSDAMRLTDDDKVLIFVSYAAILSRERRMKEANKVLSHAKVMFAGTSQEVQVLVAASQLYVDKGDFDAAIRMLDKISAESPSYKRAQIVKADIILNHNHDREGFTKCFENLVEKDPSPHSLILLGDAYLRILNPELAIDALERAYKLDPNNGRLRAKIGRALIATHEYHRALEFYESALREVARKQQQGTDRDREAAKGLDTLHLSHDLAKLYLKLRRVESANRVLKDALHNSKSDLAMMRQDVSTLLLLAKVQEVFAPHEVYETLRDAYMIQKDVLSKLRTSGGGALAAAMTEQVADEKNTLSDLACRVGISYLADERTSDAEQVLQEALQHNPQNTAAMIALARVYYYLATHSSSGGGDREREGPSAKRKAGEREREDCLEQCLSQCNKIRTANPRDRDAAILCSDVFLLKADLAQTASPSSVSEKDSDKDGITTLKDNGASASGASGSSSTSSANSDAMMDKACEALTTFLAYVPNDYIALEKAIYVLRKAGKLQDAQTYLSHAEKSDRRSVSHAGYHYCQGLFARFTNDIGKAIFEFNYARRDDNWGANALTHMIELYLNPDQDGIWEERENGPVDDATRANIAAAEELLKELKPIAKDEQRVRILESYCSMATRNKVSVDRAMQNFVEILDNDQDYLPAVLGMATGFMIEKNQHKARNLLKRVGKMEMNKHDGEDFEKANLLLAKFYIDKNKNDLAQEMCRKTLLQNKSCSQAWEILGLIFEKEGNYEMASDAYKKAWILEFEASASVGFKLAFSLLKCKRFVDAIDVCEQVLKQYPDYPRITEEILSKALQSLRTNSAL